MDKKNLVIISAIIVLVLLLLTGGIFFYHINKDQKADLSPNKIVPDNGLKADLDTSKLKFEEGPSQKSSINSGKAKELGE